MKTNRLQLAGIIKGEKGDTGKTSYEYAVDNGYQGTEEEFSQAIKDTLDAKETISQSKEEVLTAKESVDSSKTEVLAAKKSVDTAKDTAISGIQEAGTAAVNNINTKKDQAITLIQDKSSEVLEHIENSVIDAVTGSYITADGTTQGSAIIKEIQGGTKQEKTNGYQLFDASKISSLSSAGVTLTNNGDGSFTISGSGNIEGTFLASYEIKDKNVIDKILRNGVIVSTPIDTNPRFYIYGSDEKNSTVFTTSNSNGEATINDISILSSISIVFYGNNRAITPGTIKPMVYQDGDGTWEPFTGGQPSPNPDYPQEIKGMCGESNKEYGVEVNSIGKNLLSGVEKAAYSHVDGLKNKSTQYFCSKDKIKVKSGKKYILSNYDSSYSPSLLMYDGNTKYKGCLKKNYIVIPDDCEYITINIYVTNNESINNIGNIQLEESDVATSYQPYKSSVSYIPLDSPLYEGDKIYLEDGELWEYRENARVVLDGSEDENWKEYVDEATSVKTFMMQDFLNCKLGFRTSFCNKFINKKDAWIFKDYNIYSDHNKYMNKYFRPPNAEVETLEQWKTWLQSNPLEVVYKLETPTRKKLGSAEAFNLRTFDERTYIEVVGSEDLNTQNTFIVPKNQLGGLATEAFATSKQNAYKLGNVDGNIDAEDLRSYGFVEHMDILSPANRIEYVGLNKDYKPMTMDLEKHATDYGSWGNFPSLVHNKPYMVKSTGEADYQLDENNYSLKATGGDSDVANTEYDGGAFSKFIKVYAKRWIEGNDRHVRFSYIPLEGYYPCGFVDTSGLEMDHVWLPMFYGSTASGKMKSISGTQPDINQSTNAQYNNIIAFSERAAFFGGPIIETIKDMIYMLFKTTNIQEACGKGNSSGYDSAASPYYGVLPNAVVGGGQFYGSSDGKSLNKIFHSIVLGSYQQYQRDPYYLVVNGRYKVSTDYTYDPTGEKYIDTGINSETVTANKWLYPRISKPVDGFGCIPIAPFSGSSSTGYCDGVYHPADKNFTAVVLRFGYCNNGSTDGVGCLHLDYSAAFAYWNISASVLLRPPATT